jgi:hypothetical protein
MEIEWETSTDLEAMLDALKDADARKLRLFAVACCRLIQDLIQPTAMQGILALAEAFADAGMPEAQFTRLRHSMRNLFRAPTEATDAVINTISSSAWGAAVAAGESAARAAAWHKTDTNVDAAIQAETAAQCDLLREIFGNPFRADAPRPEAIAPLAQEIYNGKWDLIPLLGEWLQEHGYWDIGAHCLDPAIKHYKGCWVVDWVLGKA